MACPASLARKARHLSGQEFTGRAHIGFVMDKGDED
jgi:hypothetical protein